MLARSGLAIALFGWTLGANAAPFLTTFSGSTLDEDQPATVIPGEQFTISFVLDNGGNTAINQTWDSTHVRCVIFRFNNAQNREVSIGYAGSGFQGSNSGIFVTSGTGQLTQVPSAWTDFGEPIPNQTSNVGAGPVFSWFVNAINDVVYFDSDGTSVGLSNVGNNTTAAFWSNPVPSTASCAVAPLPQVQVPTLNEWGVIALSALLGILALFGVRRAGAGRG